MASSGKISPKKSRAGKGSSSGPKKRRPAAKKSRGARWGIFSFLLTLALWSGVVLAALLVFYGYDLPDIDTLGKSDKQPAITVLSEDGVTIATYGDIYGQYLGVSEMPPHLIEAVIATEDRRFYDHFGIDPLGIARAMFINLRAGHVVQGGSTITQQLAKNLFLSPERTIKRKVQELMLSVWLEQKFTKDEILTLYLNRVYMGSGSYGVDAAAERYFHKSARDLTLSESAIIAGLLKAPSRYSPANNPELAKERAATVIDAMVDAGFLDDKGATKAKKRPARPQAYYEGPSHGSYYFADWVLDQVPDFIGRVDEDITIVTTIDSSLQRTAEESLGRVMDNEGAGLNASQAALLSMTPDGAVRAMVGGRSYLKSQFNRATQAQRQPGSAFKLFVYTTGVEAGFLPNDTMVDRPITIRKWSPSNYDGRYRGTITLREAFAESVNSVAVQLSESVGRNRVVDMALRLGITSPIMPTPSLALGANEVNLVELTGAYAHFAHGGRSVWPYGISEIKNADGKTLYKRLNSPYARILEPHVVATMVDMMRSVIDDGTGGNARIGRAAAGKTGTSQDFRDAWFEGFTADYVTGVWVGNDDSTPMKHVTGGGLPARIWHDYMIKAHENLPARAIISYESDWSDTPRAIPWDYDGGSSASPESLPAPAALEQQPEIPDEGPNPENATMLDNLLDSLDDTVDHLDDKVEYTYPTPKKR